MIVVAGSLQIKPGTRPEALRLALWMMEKTNAESGCISYRFSSALEDENTILVFEEWESSDHLKAHFQAPHMAQFNAQLKNLVAGRSSLKRYVVTEHSAL